MGDVWGTAVPNWITAITAVAALVLATIGALAAWRSLQQQIADSQAAREREIASQARTVTAQWVTRQRAGEGGRTWTEWGLRVINHGTTTVFDVRADVEVDGRAEDLPALHTLHPGDLFVQRVKHPDGIAYAVKRMKDDVTRVQPIQSPSWRVHRITFEAEGDTLTWAPREKPAKNGAAGFSG